MWKINEVLSLDGVRYRILQIDAGEIIWINIDEDKGIPTLILHAQLTALMDAERLIRADDPYSYLLYEEPKAHSAEFIKREESYQIIQSIVSDIDCFDSIKRYQLIKEIEQSGLAGRSTIYRLLRRYWQRGQTLNALLPDYKNSGAPGQKRTSAGEQKSGRKRLHGRGDGIKITDDIERIMRLSIEKSLQNTDKLSVSSALRKFEKLFQQYYPDVPEEDKPTRRQFEYFYKREYDQVTRLVERVDEGIYKKDIRPLNSTATTGALGPGSRYEIDATIADIYLVADDNRSKIIGRPTLYIVIDVFSRMIAGFYIGFDNPSYVVAMQAFINACVEKMDICNSLGLNISTDEWPCIGLPDVILADRGELMSNQLESLISTFNVRVESAPPRRGDAKGIVESCFRVLQAEFKPYAPGVVAGNKIKKHGERDYRLDAAITISDFTRIVLKTILFRNNHHVLTKYDRDADLPTDIPSIPIHLWRWGLQHRTGRLRAVDPDLLRVSILPRKRVSISTFGVCLWGMYYTSAEILREGWLHRSQEVKRPDSLEAAYDPSCADTIYLFPQLGSRGYWICSLTEKSRQFRGMTFWQVWEIQKEEKDNQANAKFDEAAHRRELDDYIQDIIAESKKLLPDIQESNQQRVRQIRTNKKEAREQERQQRAKPATIKPEQNVANVIPLHNEEEDYSYPSFIPGLFDTDEDE
jgi:hypothetical protein